MLPRPVRFVVMPVAAQMQQIQLVDQPLFFKEVNRAVNGDQVYACIDFLRPLEDLVHIEVLLRVTQGRTEPLDLPFIKETVDRSFAKTPFLSRFYVWSMIDNVHRDELLAYDRSTREFRANPPESAQLLRRIRDLVPRKRAIVAFDTTIDGRSTYVQAQLRFQPLNSRETLSSFEAFAVDAERLRTEYFPALLRSKLEAIEGPIGFPPAKHDRMSVPPLMLLKRTSGFTCSYT